MKLSNLNAFLQKEWLPFLNINLKWGASLFIRAFFATLTIISIILLLKFSGILKDLRSLALQDIMGITPKTTTIVSAPEIDYTSDIKDLEAFIKYLEDMKPKNENK